MNTESSVQASFWLMIVLQTIGSVDMPGKGQRKLPSPRAYLAVIIAWSVLQLAVDTGYDRAASAVGWVIVLAGMVLGPFGKLMVNLFNNAANLATQGTSQ